jgi:hypothetical protein
MPYRILERRDRRWVLVSETATLSAAKAALIRADRRELCPRRLVNPAGEILAAGWDFNAARLDRVRE